MRDILLPSLDHSLVLNDDLSKVPKREVRPESFHKLVLRVICLPEEEVTQADLIRGAD